MYPLGMSMVFTNAGELKLATIISFEVMTPE
jgi:hypothetical protein